MPSVTRVVPSTAAALLQMYTQLLQSVCCMLVLRLYSGVGLGPTFHAVSAQC